MKNTIFALLIIWSSSIQAQDWFDKSCGNIDDSVTAEELKSAEDRNVLKIIINQAGDLEINNIEKPNLSEIGFKEFVLNFVTNPERQKDKAVKANKVIIQLRSLQRDSKTINKFTSYIQDVYLYLWDRESENEYQTTYIDLNCKKRAKVFNNFPLRILSESNTQNKTKSVKRKGLGLPDFGGDTVDN